RRNVDRGGVEVIEIDRSDDLFRDAGRECDGHPIPLPALRIPGALPAQMRRVREVAPRLIFEPLPLTKEIVPAVVADLADLRMHYRDLRDVRRINDHFAAVGNDRLQLVE